MVESISWGRAWKSGEHLLQIVPIFPLTTSKHIDYSLYEVLPMAVTVDLLLAVRVHPKSEDPPKIRIANVDGTKFEKREFEIPKTGDVPIDAAAHEWSNYFKSGLRGVTSLLRKKNGPDFVSVGMDIMVDGTVPSGGGLSSSAAFVCASSLAVMKASGEDKVNKRELTELAIVSERAVGVNSGGCVLHLHYINPFADGWQYGSIRLGLFAKR
jgi:galactokinase